MTPKPAAPLPGERAVLATRHGKEQVIAPLLAKGLGLIVETVPELDTDAFGAFSHDVPRRGHQLEAARAKAEAALALRPNLRFAIASEGSFGPHPAGFLPMGRELVLLIDRTEGVELTGYDVTIDTCFSHEVVREPSAALDFAKALGFPAQGVIVLGHRDGKPAPQLSLFKEIAGVAELRAAVEAAIAASGAALVETDMRAHRNPLRMEAIGRACEDLLRRYRSCCPACGLRGFDVVKRLPGRRCSHCGAPTEIARAERWACEGCGFTQERDLQSDEAEPQLCEFCNP